MLDSPCHRALITTTVCDISDIYFLFSQILIRQIEDSDNVFAISTAISNLLSLTQDGPQLCSIIAKVRQHTHTHCCDHVISSFWHPSSYVMLSLLCVCSHFVSV